MGLRFCRFPLPLTYTGFNQTSQAVSSCASDATYHVMWIILFNALDDFGVKEVGSPSNHHEIEAVKRRIAEEALHGALRISGLVRSLLALCPSANI